MLLRIISELAGGEVSDDAEVAAAMQAAIEVCCRKRLQGSDPEKIRTLWLQTIEHLGDKDWLLVKSCLGIESKH